MLVGSCMARNAFHIGEVWNSVCCHGSKIVKFKLWSTFSRILRQRVNISDANWLRYLFSSNLIKTWLSIWRHHLANLHILKTWISLEKKEIFENSKQRFSFHAGYLFVFQNGFNRTDVIFVIVAQFAHNLMAILQPTIYFKVDPEGFVTKELWWFTYNHYISNQ